MKRLLLGILALAIAGTVAGTVWAVTVNPASMVTGDSEATANTIVYRDSSGSFEMIAGDITTAKLGTDAVTSAKILDGQVTTNKIGAGSVTTAKLLLDLPISKAMCVTTAKLAGTCSNAPGADGSCNCN